MLLDANAIVAELILDGLSLQASIRRGGGGGGG
jgi:hypothetical protein